jgi:hypothetical protein
MKTVIIYVNKEQQDYGWDNNERFVINDIEYLKDKDVVIVENMATYQGFTRCLTAYYAIHASVRTISFYIPYVNYFKNYSLVKNLVFDKIEELKLSDCFILDYDHREACVDMISAFEFSSIWDIPTYDLFCVFPTKEDKKYAECILTMAESNIFYVKNGDLDNKEEILNLLDQDVIYVPIRYLGNSNVEQLERMINLLRTKYHYKGEIHVVVAHWDLKDKIDGAVFEVTNTLHPSMYSIDVFNQEHIIELFG